MDPRKLFVACAALAMCACGLEGGGDGPIARPCYAAAEPELVCEDTVDGEVCEWEIPTAVCWPEDRRGYGCVLDGQLYTCLATCEEPRL